MTRSPLLVLAVAALSGCASRFHNTSQTPPVLAQNETGNAANANPDSVQEAKEDLRKQGYRPVQMRGETHYCRKEMLTGSRFASEVCLTEDQINAMHRAREMQFVPAPCTNTNCHQ